MEARISGRNAFDGDGNPDYLFMVHKKKMALISQIDTKDDIHRSFQAKIITVPSVRKNYFNI